MANLTETPIWEEGIYQLETLDLVEGGPEGIDNLQAKQLANRTVFLKAAVESLVAAGYLTPDDITALFATQAEAEAGANNAKLMTPLRVAQAIAALATVVAASETVAGKVELATSAETITGTDTSRAVHPAGALALVNAKIAALLDSTPATLDTLNELAAALGDDPNFATTMTNALAVKLAKSGDTMTGPLTLAGAPTNPLHAATKQYVDQFGSFRNKIINGDMRIDQRNAGAAQTITAAAALAYTVDRWYAYCTGANVTGQRVAGTAPNQFNYRFTGAASVTKIGFAQRIEAANCQDLAGQTATLSVDLANSLLTTVTWTAWRANTADTFGTLASPTRTQFATGTFTVNSTLTRYNAQISVPAAATAGIEIELSVGAQTSGTWTIGRVQLESGSVATPFEHQPFGAKLALCQRYYEVISSTVSGIPVVGQATATTTAVFAIRFSVTKRATPTFSNSGPWVALTASGGSAGGGLALDNATTDTARIDVTSATGLVAGSAVSLLANGGAGNLIFSAEL